MWPFKQKGLTAEQRKNVDDTDAWARTLAAEKAEEFKKKKAETLARLNEFPARCPGCHNTTFEVSVERNDVTNKVSYWYVQRAVARCVVCHRVEYIGTLHREGRAYPLCDAEKERQ